MTPEAPAVNYQANEQDNGAFREADKLADDHSDYDSDFSDYLSLSDPADDMSDISHITDNEQD